MHINNCEARRFPQLYYTCGATCPGREPPTTARSIYKTHPIINRAFIPKYSARNVCVTSCALLTVNKMEFDVKVVFGIFEL